MGLAQDRSRCKVACANFCESDKSLQTVQVIVVKIRKKPGCRQVAGPGLEQVRLRRSWLSPS